MQLEKVEKSFTVYRPLPRPFIPSFNHIDLLTYYFIMNMISFVIVCVCHCVSVPVTIGSHSMYDTSTIGTRSVVKEKSTLEGNI